MVRTAKPTSHGAFTLIELLVVISIIVVLLTLLVPALDRALEHGAKVVCGAHSNGIFKGVRAFSLANKNKVHTYHRQNAKWFDDGGGLAGSAADEAATTDAPSADGRPQIDPSDHRAYWGVLYTHYGVSRDMFNCPSAERNDWKHHVTDGDRNDPTYTDEMAWEDGGKWTSYGFNGVYNKWFTWTSKDQYTGDSDVDDAVSIGVDSSDGSYHDEADDSGGRPAKKFTQVQNPSGSILFHDAFEVMMEVGSPYGSSNDSYYGLADYSPVTADPEDDSENAQGYLEYLRHLNGGNMAWGDGHVEYWQSPKDLSKTPDPGGKFVWYSGGDIRPWQ